MMNISRRIQVIALLAMPMMMPARVVKAQPPQPVAPDTPEQRKQASRSSAVESMRLLMRIYDLTDVTMQNTIIVFLQEQGAKRYTLRQQKDKLMNKREYALLPDAQVSALLNEYRATAQQVKVDYEKSLVELDTKIGYSKNPRLEIILMELGVVGDEESIANGPARFGVFAEPPQVQAANPQ